MAPPDGPPSKSQVKRAGSTIRRFGRGELEDVASFNDAVEVMELWRRTHQLPLVTANNGLRSMARTENVAARISQRLKRRQTILDKLTREPSLDLSRMQDIGGCRAIVTNIDELRRLEARLMRRRQVLRHSDYVVTPRASGYRAVHVVVDYGGRAIEVQLRTGWMHEWAQAAERYSGTLGENLKQDGTHPIQLFLAAAAEIMALQAEGADIPSSLLDLHRQRRLEALPYVDRNRG